MLQKPIPVLMYHQIDQGDPQSSLVVSPQTFQKQWRWLLERNFDFLSLDEVLERGGLIPWSERAVALTFDDGFQDNAEHAFPLILEEKKPAALFVIVDWVGKNGFLHWKEIRKLSDQGVTIGSHSLSHRWLPDFDDRTLKREIFESKERIEQEISREVRHFSYPVGGVDRRVSALVEEAGYRAAWVSGARPTEQVGNPRFSLRRLKVGPSDGQTGRFALKAYGVKSFLQKAFGK